MLSMARSPNKSLSAMCDTEAEREGMYRFIRNSHLDWRDLLKPHVEQTQRRAAEAGAVLAIHDTTTIRVHEDADLRSFINTGKRGFLAHVTLLANAEQVRQPLGVISARTILRRSKKAKTKKNGRKLSGAETARLKHKEYARWGEQIRETSSLLEDCREVVHLIDREGDSYALLHELVAQNESFVIRWCRDRKAAHFEESAPTWSYVSELIEEAPDTTIERKVPLSPRKAKTAPTARKKSPPRKARIARLKVAATTLLLRRPKYLRECDETIPVNVVYVYEPDPPSEQDRVEWVLLTSLPIEDDQQVERVIDYYRQRWLIEEFFKALKSGCNYTRRGLTNQFSIFNTLACFIPIAWKALLLRQAARVPQATCSPEMLDADELQVLRIKADKMKMPLPNTPTAQQALAVIASLGGHRKHRGPPGWMTIMRGMDRFQSITEGWKLALQSGNM